MSMKERTVGDVVVLELSGSLMDSRELDAFRDHLYKLKDRGTKKVVIDLGGINLMASAGIGMLVAGAKTMREVGGDLKLANLQDRTYNVLVVVTRLGSVFDIKETADQAIAAFQ